MNLSAREVAALLGCSPRTVRAQMARGDLPGVKQGGRWWLDRRRLPLTEVQRQALQGKAESLREALEAALPSRLAATPGQRRRSVVDLDSFRRGAALLSEIREQGGAVLPRPVQERVSTLLERALLDLAEAAHHFDRERKLRALHGARSRLARAAGVLLLQSQLPPAEPVHGWVVALETEVIPALAGFTRWAEGLRGRRP